MVTFTSDQVVSYGNPADLKTLRKAVCDTGRPLTIVAGAGISMNASLPSWDCLVSNMASSIGDKTLCQMIEADRSDAMRKAGIVLNLLAERNPARERHEFVRDALYPRGLQPTPGQLAFSIARLVKARDGNVQLLTTNYDNLLEQALKYYYDACLIESFSLDQVDAWNAWRSAGKVGVLHLHGLLEQATRPKEPIILTESQFLEHGPKVRQTISTALEDSNAIFVGLGMADPNLVVPLYKIGTPPSAHRFVLVVPRQAPGSNGDSGESDRYAFISAGYLEAELGVRPIFLQSYSELNQTLSDLSLAIVEPDRYRDRPTDASLVYSKRFTRTLERCYQKMGCGKSGQVPDREKARELNEKLYEALRDGPLRMLNEVRRNYWGPHRNGSDEPERFALFLWLRTRRPIGGDPPYSLNLVGTSAYVHREGWSMRRVEKIVENSTTAAVQAVFAGTPNVVNMDPSGQEPNWRGIVAAPIILEGTCSASMIGGSAADILTIGAITLNSTRKVVRPGDARPDDAAYSIISRLKSSDFNKLMTSLDAAADHVLRPLLSV
jgi:SIR2-like domain